MTPAMLSAAEQSGRRAMSRSQYERYLPLVRRTAMRYARKVPSHVTIDDLIGYGWVGLVEAFGRSEEGMPENEFEAYALYRVRGAMLDFLRGLDPVKRKMRAASRRVARAISELNSALGRQPEEDEIARHMGVDLDSYRAMLLEIERAGMARLELLDIDEVELRSDDGGVDDEVLKAQLAARVAGAIESLPERPRYVLALYYQEQCTLREIGAILGLTESRICQIHTEAIHRLRAAIGRE